MLAGVACEGTRGCVDTGDGAEVNWELEDAGTFALPLLPTVIRVLLTVTLIFTSGAILSL